MPFKSKAQNAWAHTPAGTKALGGPAKVKEWESATDYSHLPQKLAQGGPVKHEAPNESPAHEAKETPAEEAWEKRTGQEISSAIKAHHEGREKDSAAHEAKETPAQEREEERTGRELYAHGGLVKGNRTHHQSHEQPHKPSIGGANDGHGIFAQGGPVRNETVDRHYKTPTRNDFGHFLSTEDRFSGGRKPAGYPQEAETEEKWLKSKGVGRLEADDYGDCKSLPPVLPHGAGNHWYGKK